jgi:hypothetical protein
MPSRLFLGFAAACMTVALLIAASTRLAAEMTARCLQAVLAGGAATG